MLTRDRLRRLALSGAFAATAALHAAAAHAATVSGVVVDPAGKPIEYANVSVASLHAGAVADEQGRFHLELPAGRYELSIGQIGYLAVRRSIEVAATPVELRVALAEEPVAVDEVVVTASSFGREGKGEGATLRRMDIVMTPGGTADVFQALRALPGINAPDEGAALYVRGGDPHESLIRLDGAELGHPYHYESASGGLFSSLAAYMLKSAYFSSGGFPARYGGALSGVLDIETQDPWNLKTVSLGANMVGGSASTSWAIVPDRLSFIGSGRFSRLDVLDALYGSTRDYVSLPRSADGAAKLLYRYSPAGRLSLLGMRSGDELQVRSQRFNYDGTYSNHTRNRVGVVQWQQAVGGVLALNGSAAIQGYDSDSRYGVLDRHQRERNFNTRLDGRWDPTKYQRSGFGLSLQRLGSDLTGSVPADSTDLGPGAATRTRATRPRAWAPGVWAEHEWRVAGPVYATLGARADYTTTSREWTADPRAALAWRIDARQTLRVATGRYHQLPAAEYLDPVYGNPALRPMSADHVIAGYEWKDETTNARLEVFRKDYRDLVTRSATTWYANGGHGYARGVDAFIQRSHGRATGWVGYGYLDTRRRELDDPRELPSVYGVRHSLTLVGSLQLTSASLVGARWGFSSGRPYTPVLGGRFDPVSERWSPVTAENQSGLLPDHRRLDVRITQLFSLPRAAGVPASSVCAAYVEALNVLVTRNVLDYAYTADYSQRLTIDSYFSRRMAVAGFALTW